MVETPGQENQRLIHGGNYVKNILAFFTMFALFLLIKEGKWRDHLLIGSFTMGYLAVIALSAFAQSGALSPTRAAFYFDICSLWHFPFRE